MTDQTDYIVINTLTEARPLIGCVLLRTSLAGLKDCKGGDKSGFRIWAAAVAVTS